MNYNKETDQPISEKPMACSFCGSIEVTAFWRGPLDVCVCQKCATEVLPALLADSIPGAKLRAANHVNDIVYQFEALFQAAFRKALLTRYAVRRVQAPDSD